MNWLNVATIVSALVMVALGVYFLTWMTKNQRRAAEQYQEQQRAAAAAEAPEADEVDVPQEGTEVVGESGLSDADRLESQEQHPSSGSV
jgi:Tfp pilus assembly protein PilN